MGKRLLALGLMTEIDKAALSAYCTAWARHVEAEQALQQYGMVLVSKDGGVAYQSPYLSIANKALEQMMKCLVEFGMSPSSRSRVSAASESGEPDKWGSLLP